MKKTIHHSDARLFIALAVLVIGVTTFAAGYFALLTKNKGTTPVICPDDAMICPGGAAVSRSGPSCEFTPCPSTKLPKGKGLTEDPIEVPGTDPQDGKIKSGVMCTEEVKMCSDGSYVGRSGPNCAFAPCPNGGGDFLGL